MGKDESERDQLCKIFSMHQCPPDHGLPEVFEIRLPWTMDGTPKKRYVFRLSKRKSRNNEFRASDASGVTHHGSGCPQLFYKDALLARLKFNGQSPSTMKQRMHTAHGYAWG